MSETMSVTRGLAELKLLDARIRKQLQYLILVDVFQNKKDQVANTHMTKAEFTKHAKAAKQAITDLIERRQKIKSAILLSNATTDVTIGNITCKVIEAIERKNSIDYEVKMLLTMREQLKSCQNIIEKQKPELDREVEHMLNNHLGGDRKPSEDDYKNIATPYLNAREYQILDPCNTKEAISELDSNIDSFLSEVDFVLSESNATTMIEI